MSDAPHFRKLEQMYLSAPNNRYYEPTIQVTPGKAVVSFTIRPEFYHAAGAAHGSIYFKAADDAAFFAVNSLVTEYFVLTTNLNLTLLRPVKEGVITGTGTVIAASKRLFQAESTLVNAEGQEVARAMATFIPSRIPLTSDIGYRLPG
ncbi:MAG: hotdog fold thioesterase [Candidatus Hydrogenedens sp.]|nr:hotdog fold thioesterase [Candidatus Hydrogenedens sp.]